jgi:hypothetical protein
VGGLGQLKNPMTLSGVKPAALWLVVQWIDQLCYNMPRSTAVPALLLKPYPILCNLEVKGQICTHVFPQSSDLLIVGISIFEHCINFQNITIALHLTDMAQ